MFLGPSFNPDLNVALKYFTLLSSADSCGFCMYVKFLVFSKLNGWYKLNFKHIGLFLNLSTLLFESPCSFLYILCNPQLLFGSEPPEKLFVCVPIPLITVSTQNTHSAFSISFSPKICLFR